MHHCIRGLDCKIELAGAAPSQLRVLFGSHGFVWALMFHQKAAALLLIGGSGCVHVVASTLL